MLDLERGVLIGLVLVVGFLVLAPAAVLLYASVLTAPPGDKTATLTLDNFSAALSQRRNLDLLGTTLIYAAGTTILAVVVGTALAWVVSRTNAPGRRLFAVLALVPFLMPLFLGSIAWIFLLSPRIGLINTFLMAVFGLTEAPFNVGTIGGMIWVTGLYVAPLVFISVAPSFRSMDPSFEDAARLSGSGPVRTFFTVTLPLALPSVLSAAILVFIVGLEAFDVPAFIGRPAGIQVYTTRIFESLRVLSPPNYGLASALATLLLVLAVICVVGYGRATRNTGRFVTVTGRGYRAGISDLGGWRWVAAGGCWLFFVFTVFLPLAILVLTSLVGFYSGFYPGILSELTLANYQRALQHPLFLRSLRNTLILAIGGAAACALLAALVSYVTVRTRLLGRSLLAGIATLPLAFPAMVFAVGLLWTYLLLPLGIYGTLWILLIAYVTRGLPLAMRTISGALFQVHTELEEAARTSGSSWGRTFVEVVLPLLRPALLSSGLVLFMIFSRELTASILLYSSGNEVLSTTLFGFFESGEMGTLAALSALLMVLTTVLIVAAQRLFKVELAQ